MMTLGNKYLEGGPGSSPLAVGPSTFMVRAIPPTLYFGLDLKSAVNMWPLFYRLTGESASEQ